MALGILIGIAIGWAGHIVYQLKKENDNLKKKNGTEKKEGKNGTNKK